MCYILLQADGSNYVLRIDDEQVWIVGQDTEEIAEKNGVILTVHTRIIEAFFRKKITFPSPVVCIRFIPESGIHEL